MSINDARSSAQPSLLGYHNTGLFSDFFLENRLHEVEGWDATAAEAAELQVRLRALYSDARPLLDAAANEAQTEHDFVRPALDAAGFVYDVQTGLPAWGGAERPDYAIFPSAERLAAALPERGKLSFYAGADTILDAKAWSLSLDALDRARSRKTPSQQIGGYIQRANLDYGILTNGRKWRLYTSSRQRTIENYYEVDLVELLEASPEEFRYFSCFFTPRAFDRGADGRCFLDRVFSGSIAYAVEVGSVLRDRAYEVVELLASGFASGRTDLGRDELDQLYANSLIVLYRLLFCFYAEGRELLPIHNPSYNTLYSLSELKQRAADTLDNRLTLSRTGREFWSRLANLFALVDHGDEDLGMPEGYDGGLFDPERHPFLSDRVVPDLWLAPAVDQLSRVDDSRTGGREFVDYGDLKIRDLGTIYEGLLEFRLELAVEPLWLVRHNGRDVYTETAPRRGRPPDVQPGSLYLSNDRRERRVSGSYYTPDYIVTAIVERTLGPLLARISEAAGDDGASFVRSTLEMRVLDPAMGSGHFLVEAADYLAMQIATHPAVEAIGEGEDESEVRTWRRRVAESCLYGVDLNPLAVELAKLSLWLATVSTGKPLSFLDHHLRCGNSLIGTRLEDLRGTGDLFSEALGSAAAEIVAELARVTLHDTTSMEDVDVKVAAEHEAGRLRRPFERIADHLVGRPFVTEPAPDVATVLAAGDAPRSVVATGERFFHWELTFPDAFFGTDGSPRQDAGFDAVVMNPPYIRIQDFPRAHADYFRRAYAAAFGSFNVYVLFIERTLSLLAPQGRAGMIVPNVFFHSEYGQPLRTLLAEARAIDLVVDFGDNQVFEDATNYTCLLYLEPAAQELRYALVATGASHAELERAAASPDDLEPAAFNVALLPAPWVFASGEVGGLLDRLREQSETLGALAQIFQGLLTSADPIYIVRDLGASATGGRRVWSAALDREVELETALLRRLASGEDVDRYSFVPLSKLLIFPYREGQLLSSDEIETEASRTWAYLEEHEQALRARERGRMDVDGSWHAFGRNQNLTLHDLPKLGVAATVRRLELAPDPTGDVYFHNVRVNGILLDENAPPFWYVLALLNSRLLDFIFRRGAARHANGYYAANKQFIAPLPIQRGTPAAVEQLAELGRTLHSLSTQITRERDGFGRWLRGELGTEHTLPDAFDRYEAVDDETLLAALRQHRRHHTTDPSSRAFRERFVTELGASRERLAGPLRDTAARDVEADAAVYDLYELTNAQRLLIDAEYEATSASESTP